VKEQLYLRDVLSDLFARAREARESARQEAAKAPGDAGFEAGRLQGYYEVLSVLVGQLDAFGIPRSSVGVPDILSLEKELL
jgi:hypothetical protein